jgi:hypothetical protein
MIKLCPLTVELILASLPLWLMLTALLVPTKRPVLLRTLNTPVVLVAASDLMNCVLLRLLIYTALLAVPAKLAELAVVSVIPGYICGNALSKLACGINAGSS